MLPQISFILSCLILNYCYPKVDAKLFTLSKKYGLLTAEKQAYVIKNVLKSGYLCLIFIACIYFVFPDLIKDRWNNTILQTFASMYVSNDIVGLYNVRLHTSTRLHHVTCAVFLLGAWSADFQHSTTAQMLCIYTIFSAITFPVNLYLGLRYIFEIEDPDMISLKLVSKWVYVGCCVFNWLIQIYMGYMNHEIYLMAYYFGLIFIIYDDIVLLKWLFK